MSRVLNVEDSHLILAIPSTDVGNLKDILNGIGIENWSFSEKEFAGKLRKQVEEAEYAREY